MNGPAKALGLAILMAGVCCSGTGGGEDCENGVDDDGDGRIDCEDPDCAEHHDCACTTGDERPCECPDGRDGSQECTGDEWGDCECTECGDGVCQAEEDRDSCPEDCAIPCGDGVCDEGENHERCPEDCDPVTCGANLLGSWDFGDPIVDAIGKAYTGEEAIVATARRVSGFSYDDTDEYACRLEWTHELNRFCGNLAVISSSYYDDHLVYMDCSTTATELRVVDLSSGDVQWSRPLPGGLEAGPMHSWSLIDGEGSFYLLLDHDLYGFATTLPFTDDLHIDLSGLDVPGDCTAVGGSTRLDQLTIAYSCSYSDLSFITIELAGTDSYSVVSVDHDFSRTNGDMTWYLDGFYGRNFVGLDGMYAELSIMPDGSIDVIYTIRCEDAYGPPQWRMTGWSGGVPAVGSCSSSVVAFEYSSATYPSGDVWWQEHVDPGPLSPVELLSSGTAAVGGRDGLYILSFNRSDAEVDIHVSSTTRHLRDVTAVVEGPYDVYMYSHGKLLVGNAHGDVSCVDLLAESGVLCEE